MVEDKTVTAGDGAQAAAAILAGTTIRQYELIRELGRGGMGQVFLARDTRLGRRVALKFLARGLTERFIEEARTTARCTHENIVVIHEVDEHSGVPYMVLEYLEGTPLRALIGAPVSVARAAELTVPVARALVCAHEFGIVHRDLKPENIFVTTAGAIKVLDFGVAGTTSSGSSAVMGTLAYMSPEQLAGEVDARIDVWALGVVLHELLAGTSPLPATRLELMAELVDERPLAITVPDEVKPIVARCLAKNKADRYATARELCDELERLLPARHGRRLAVDESPFPGLATFQEGDADRFFGRDVDVARVVARLREHALVAVVGPSGVGKSSLVRAGVAPALKASGETWDVHVLRPGRDPLAALAALVDVDADALAREPGALGAKLRSTGRRHLVFVDQLEELVTQGADDARRRAFTACLTGIADDASGPLRVIVSVRSDFLDRLGEDPRFLDELTRGLVFLQPLGKDGLRDALARPLEPLGYAFESPRMVDGMVDALATTPGALPLLQFAASRLWDARDRTRKVLTQAAHDAIGGVAGALASHADEVVASLSPMQRKLARRVLQRLVTPERTRAIVDRGELRGLGDVDAIVDRLVAARLLVGDASTTELVHESLVSGWPTLRRWLDEDHEDSAYLAQVRAAAKQWDAKGRPVGLLWRGEAEREARQFRARVRELADSERAYLDAVVAAGSRAARVRRVAVIGSIAVLAGALAVVGGLYARGNAKARELHDNLLAEYEEQGRRLVVDGDPLRGLAYLERAEDYGASGTAHDYLVAKALRDTDGEVFEVRHDIAAFNVRFSPDGKRLLSTGYDGKVLVTDVETGRVQLSLAHDGLVRDAMFSNDGDRILTMTERDAKLWDAHTGDVIATLASDTGLACIGFTTDGLAVSGGHDTAVTVWDAHGVLHSHLALPAPLAQCTVSPDGIRVAVADSDHRVRVWRLADGMIDRELVFDRNTDVRRFRFAPRGDRLLELGIDGTTAIEWDLAGLVAQRLTHPDRLWAASYSPDETQLAIASEDHTVTVWDLATASIRGKLVGHGGPVYQVEYSPDGRFIATGSDDASVWLWDARVRFPVARWRGHDIAISHIAFAPSGGDVASAAEDGRVIVWRAVPQVPVVWLVGHHGDVNAAQLSPNGDEVATGGGDGSVRTWDAHTGGQKRIIRESPHVIRDVRYSPDGRFIASTSEDGAVEVWDSGRDTAVALSNHHGKLGELAWSADGKVLAGAAQDGTLVAWDVIARRIAWEIRAHNGTPVWAVTYALGGLVSVGDDRLRRHWDLDGHERTDLEQPAPDGAADLAFDHEGRRVAIAAMANNVVTIVDDATGKATALVGHHGLLRGIAWSTDDGLVVSAGMDACRVWDTNTNALVDLVLPGGTATSISSEGRFAFVLPDGTIGLYPLAVRRNRHDLHRLRPCRTGYQITDRETLGSRTWLPHCVNRSDYSVD